MQKSRHIKICVMSYTYTHLLIQTNYPPMTDIICGFHPCQAQKRWAGQAEVLSGEDCMLGTDSCSCWIVMEFRSSSHSATNRFAREKNLKAMELNGSGKVLKQG